MSNSSGQPQKPKNDDDDFVMKVEMENTTEPFTESSHTAVFQSNDKKGKEIQQKKKKSKKEEGNYE